MEDRERWNLSPDPVAEALTYLSRTAQAPWSVRRFWAPDASTIL